MSNSAQGSDPAEASTTVSPRQGAAISAFAIRAALGLARVALLLWLYGPARIVESLARERLAFFALAVAIYIAGQAMSSYRWMLLARLVELRGPWRDYFRWYFIGMFTNLFVPGLIGGDAARSAYLGLRHRRMGSAIASVAADRGIGLLALFWFAAIAAIIARPVALPRVTVVADAAIVFASFAGYLAGPILAAPAARLPGRLGMLAAPILPYMYRPAALIPAIALSIVLQASLAYAQYLLALGMGLAVPLSAMMVVVPMANVVAALPLTLNGLGVREGAYAILLGTAGVAHQDAIALGLLWFSCTIVGGLAGLPPFLLTPIPSARDIS
jgi:uncharacterized membrane protein YbhN (UPF0104 family)